MLLTYGLMRAVQYIRRVQFIYIIEHVFWGMGVACDNHDNMLWYFRGIDEVENETADLNSVNQNSRNIRK